MKPGALLRLERAKYVAGLLLLAASAFTLLSLISFSPWDVAYFQAPPQRPAANVCGRVGAYTAFALLRSVGWMGYIVPVVCGVFGVLLLRQEKNLRHWPGRYSGFLFFVLSGSVAAAMMGAPAPVETIGPGGALGLFLRPRMVRALGSGGGSVVIGTALGLGLLLMTDFALVDWVRAAGRRALGGITVCCPALGRGICLVGWGLGVAGAWLGRVVAMAARGTFSAVASRRSAAAEARGTADDAAPVQRSLFVEEEAEEDEEEPPPPKLVKAKVKPRRPADEPKPGPAVAAASAASAAHSSGDFTLPSLELLNAASVRRGASEEDLQRQGRLLEETLRSFGVEVRVAQINEGPVISSYELELAKGVAVSKINARADDIALALRAHSVRIIAPIPGKARVGVEVPNPDPDFVYLRDVLSSDAFRRMNSRLALAIGRDIVGTPIVADLAKMPHMLIAGTTGSGKTVCVNSLLLSILFHATPDEVQFLLIDPKMVELSPYQGIPHLLAPVITHPKRAAMSLKWLVGEMEQRYKLLAEHGARNISAYNQTIDKGASGEKLPQIVVIIDELADLMMVAQGAVEDAIQRIAQLSRAVGIHLLLATQRPSVDVITGVIKTNLPYRLSFQMASKVDSRTVLDMNGAETLLGCGDMLYLPAGSAKPIRAQGSLVEDEEIHRVVEFLKAQRPPAYRDDLIAKTQADSGSDGDEGDEGRDELFDSALQVILQTRQASASTLQRRLRVGYARAARIIDQLEDAGFIGASRGSKPREILTAAVAAEAEDE